MGGDLFINNFLGGGSGDNDSGGTIYFRRRYNFFPFFSLFDFSSFFCFFCFVTVNVIKKNWICPFKGTRKQAESLK